jgi:hypothetical protein
MTRDNNSLEYEQEEEKKEENRETVAINFAFSV